MLSSRSINLRLIFVCSSWLLLLGACAADPATSPSTTTTMAAAPAPTDATESSESETIVVKDVPYYQSTDGATWSLDIYSPSNGDGHPLVVLFHGNPVFGQTKDNVATLAAMIAERGAVVVAPSWGSRMSMLDMNAIAVEFHTWIAEQGPCAVWAAVDLASSHGANDGQPTLVGLTTGVLPAQAATFDLHPSVDGCLFPWVLAPPEQTILFDTDWLLVPSIWDEVLVQDPSFLESSSYWDRVSDPASTKIVMLAGEITASETVRSLEGREYTESEWIHIRDPEGRLADAFAASGTLDDGSMSFADVAHVAVTLLAEGGWDAELLIVPGAAHSVSSETARGFIADLVFAD